MAFGLFKKTEMADTIFMGGKVYTQDPELPWAEAVACKDGKILAVGDYTDLQELENSNTEVVDLKNGILLPGFIDLCGHPVMKTFTDNCLMLPEALPLEEVLAQISNYIATNTDAEAYLIYGYHEDILSDYEPEQMRALLDEICDDKPVAVLGRSGIHAWFNNFALETAIAVAEEEKVKNLTVPYVLNVLAPLDFEAVQEAVIRIAGEYCEKGFTSIFDCGAPDYLDSVYQDVLVTMLQEGMPKQRYYGCLLILRDVNPEFAIQKLAQKKTHCNELNGYLNVSTLKLIIDSTGDAPNISQPILYQLCMESGDRGFDVHIDALDKEAAEASIEVMSAARNAGYRKNRFSIACDEDTLDETLADSAILTGISIIPPTACDSNDFYQFAQNAKDMIELIDKLTIDAAIQLGISDQFGSIKRGKFADFVIFDEDIFESPTISDFKKLNCAMTVVNGEIVYDAAEDDMSDWYSMMSEQYL